MLSKLRHLPLLLILIILSGMIAPRAIAQDDDTPPLDIILLLDTSGSTIYERDLIEQAAKFLLDYLDANVDFVNLDYRLGVAGFNQDINQDSVIRLGRPSLSNLSNFFIDTPAGGDTDFKRPLNFALSEFDSLKSLDGHRTPIVILMTDGQPASGGEVLPNLDDYFGDLGQIVSTTDDAGIQVFVVGVGGAQADENRWLEVLPQDDRYEYIDDSSNLSEVYWRILSEFIEGTQDEVVELTADQAYDIGVEPYVDELTITVLKDEPGANVKIVNPDGNVYEKAPTRGGGEEDLHEIYVITTPEKGDWEITLEGANGRLLVNRRYPQIILSTENSAVAVGNEFSVQATLDSESLAELDPERLTLLLAEEDKSYEEYDGNNDELVFELLEDGFYEIIFEGFEEPDDYDLIPIVLVDGKLLESVNTEGISLKAVELPDIVYLDTEKRQDGSYIIEYDIENVDDIQDMIPQLEVVKDGELLFEEDIKDYDADDESIVDNHPLQQEGEYEIILHIEGTSPDGLNYRDTYKITLQIPQLNIPPVIQPTHKPPPTFPPPPTRDITPEATTQPSQNDTSAKDFNIMAILWIFLLALFSVIAFFVYKNRKSIKKTNVELESVKEPPRQKDLNQYEDKQHNDQDSDKTKDTIDDKTLEERVVEALNKVEDDGSTAVLELKNQLPKLEQHYSEGNGFDKDYYYDDYIRTTLNKLNGLQTQVFLSALASSLMKYWDEENGPERIVAIVYDKILILTSNSSITFSAIIRAFLDVPGRLIAKDFIRNWEQIGNNLNENTYKKLLELDDIKSNRVNSLKETYGFLQKVTTSSYSFGNREIYNQLKANISHPEEGWKSENLYLLMKDTGDIFTQSPPADPGEWSEYIASLKKVLNDINNPNKSYTRLPEKEILKDLINQWISASNEKLKKFGEEPIAISPGKVELEIRPNLDLYMLSDESESSQDWEYIIRGVLFHMGGADIENLQLFYMMNHQESISIISSQKENLKLTRNDHQKFEFYPPAVEPTNISFELDYQTMITVGNNNEVRRTTERVNHKLNIAPDLHSFSLEEKIKDPFVLGAPLIKEQFNQFGLKKPPQMVADLINYLTYLQVPAFITLEGLRQSGKTTIMNMVLEAVDVNIINNKHNYFVIHIDLMKWYQVNIEKTKTKRKQDFRSTFWQACYKSFNEKLRQNQNFNGFIQIDETENGMSEFMTFKNLLGSLYKESGVKPLLVVDDADLFEEFDDEIPRLAKEMISLCEAANGVIWTANDNRSVTWIDAFGELFKTHKYADHKRFKTRLIEQHEVENVLTINDTLALTPLAARAAYVFTGGWISFVQLLGRDLVYGINKNFDEDSKQALRLITVDDIRSVISYRANADPDILTYLTQSFTPYEMLLMQILVKVGMVDPDTGILQGIRFKFGWLGQDFLQEKIQQSFLEENFTKEDLDYFEEHWRALFYQLKEKEILENIVFHGQLSPLVRFRVGWLYSFLRGRPYFAIKRVNSKVYKASDKVYLEWK